MKKMMTAASVLVASVFLTGFGDSTAATKENFAKGIQEKFDKLQYCTAWGGGEKISSFEEGSPYNNALDVLVVRPEHAKYTEEKLDTGVFLKYGLVEKKNDSVNVKFWDAIKGKAVPEKTDVVIYKVTEKGKDYFKVADGQFGGKAAYFCGGKFVVKSVDLFTPPKEDKNGFTFSKVKFTVQLENLPDWVQEIQDKPTTDPIQHTIKLILTSDGWKTEDAIQ
ncbi:hypothetical protein [Lonepinella sp. BR2882]|uniref:hypothetical protein n=1 Tax=Lonepinella sp. BR2882 TaxID=3095283 RepID=UPI003F6DEB04